jgi:hypothetical protein
MSPRPIRLLKKSLKQLRPSPGCRQWVLMAFRHPETSLHRIHQSRFCTRPEGRLWVLRFIHLLKTSLKRPFPSQFFRCLGCTKWVRILFWYLETSLHRLQQGRFLWRPEGKLWVLRPFAYFKHHWNELIIDFFRFTGSTKWFFMAYRHIFISLHQSRILRLTVGRLWVLTTIRLLKTSSIGIPTNRFF